MHMKNFRQGRGQFIAMAMAFLLGPITTVHAMTISLASDVTWPAFNASNVALGNAQYVCPTAGWVGTCPGGATIWNHDNDNVWVANLSSIPGAFWIYAPGIVSTTKPASLVTYSFSKSIEINGTPTAGTMHIATDDFAAIIVNGGTVGTIGSISNSSLAGQAQNQLHAFDILPFLINGTNEITVLTTNGPDSFTRFSNPDYSQNVAGVVFGGSITFEPLQDPQPGSGVAPEPASIALLALTGVALLQRRRR